MEELIWQPTPETIRNSNLQRFMEKYGVPSFEALQERALQDPAWFWQAVTEDLGIAWHQPFTQVLDTSRGIPWATWFRGARMNMATDCVDKHVQTRPDQVAVLYESEDGHTRRWTFAELQAESNRVANALREIGIEKGDRIGVYMPMVPEIVAVIMGIAKLGAIFVPIFSGYAAQAAATRLVDGEARLLVCSDAFLRRGGRVNMKAAAAEAAALSPTVERVLVVRSAGGEVEWTPGRDIWYHELVGRQSAQFETESMDPEDPFMLIYTSGTTGKPKGTVHVHGGFPLKTTQDMSHLFDLKEKEILFWFTDIGWMMGPWAIFGSLMLGATCFLYDGAPNFPGPDRMWALVERHRITHLGLSPTVIRALMPHGDEPVARHDLSSLRILGSTGEPWNPDPYMWYFEKVGGGRCPIINYSGGTEISGGILGCVPIRPLRVASFNAAVPGIGAGVVDEAGQPVEPGMVGELVMRTPWPGMTRGFWRDPERYIKTYWSRWESIWWHGDWASRDADGFWYIHGRSDDTIKIAGKRVGPAEIESVLVAHPAVAEAATVGVPHPVKGEVLVCFTILKQASLASPALEQELRDLVADQMGKALKPEAIKFVQALPKTRNAKIMRRVIRAAYLGEPLGDLTALENPEAVAEISRLRGS